jgi:hypothetical protein
MANTGKRRGKTLGVPVSEDEEALIAIGAALGAEDVAGYLRRLAVMNARRRIVANGGVPPAPVVEKKGG